MITGASSGIGEASARRFAAAGCRLILCGRNKEALQRIADELNVVDQAEVYVSVFDVRSKETLEAEMNSIPETFLPVDILINNAGLSRGFEPLTESNTKDWEEMIDTNLKGFLYVSRAVGRIMLKQGKGHIIHMGSVAGKQAYPNGSVYCATKAAVDFVTDAFRMEVFDKGIKVSVIHPGMVETNFSLTRFHGDAERAAKVYEGLRALRAADVAEVIWFMASAPEHVNVADVVLLSADQTPEGRLNRRIE